MRDAQGKPFEADVVVSDASTNVRKASERLGEQGSIWISRASKSGIGSPQEGLKPILVDCKEDFS